MSQPKRRKREASLKRMSVALGAAIVMVCEGDRWSSIGVHERGTTMKKFYLVSRWHDGRGESYHPETEVEQERQI